MPYLLFYLTIAFLRFNQNYLEFNIKAKTFVDLNSINTLLFRIISMEDLKSQISIAKFMDSPQENYCTNN